MEQWTWGDVFIYFLTVIVSCFVHLSVVQNLIVASKLLWFVVISLPIALLKEFTLVNWRVRSPERGYTTSFEFLALLYVRWVLKTFTTETVRTVFFSNHQARILFSLRKLKYGTENIGDFDYDPVNTGRCEGYWVRSKSRRDRKPDVTIYFVPGAMGGGASVYLYLEYLSMMLVELQLQGFRNPAVFCVDAKDEGYTDFDYLRMMKQVIEGYKYTLKEFPAGKHLVMGSGLGGTAILSMLLHISRPQTCPLEYISSTKSSKTDYPEANESGFEDVLRDDSDEVFAGDSSKLHLDEGVSELLVAEEIVTEETASKDVGNEDVGNGDVKEIVTEAGATEVAISADNDNRIERRETGVDGSINVSEAIDETDVINESIGGEEQFFNEAPVREDTYDYSYSVSKDADLAGEDDAGEDDAGEDHHENYFADNQMASPSGHPAASTPMLQRLQEDESVDEDQQLVVTNSTRVPEAEADHILSELEVTLPTDISFNKSPSRILTSASGNIYDGHLNSKAVASRLAGDGSDDYDDHSSTSLEELFADIPPSIPHAALLISPLSRTVMERFSRYPDLVTAQSLGKLCSATVASQEENLLWTTPLCVKDMKWWSESMPERGMVIMYGGMETLRREIEALISTLRGCHPRRVVSSCNDQQTHAWPIVSAYLGRTTTDQMDGITQVACQIANMLVMDCLFDEAP